MPPRLMSIIGIGAIILVCCAVSSDRRRINWITVGWGLALQFAFGLLILKTYPDRIFEAANAIFSSISLYSGEGAKFLFGSLAEHKDFVILGMGSVIIFVSAVLAALNYARILPVIIYGLARLMQKTMRTSGAETLAAAMFILMGIEGVTGLKTVIGRMTRSELFTVMTCFMATIAGSVMAVYVGVFGASAGHIMAASIMSAPAALALSKIMIPETLIPETAGRVEWKTLIPQDRGFVEAAANGALDGLRLAATIGAILLAFVSIIYMLDAVLGIVGTSFGTLGGYFFAPIAYCMGVPWEDCMKVGNLLALKTVFNEWLAYSRMQEMVTAGELAPRSVMILTYALCSFANFGSLAILIGGISALAPDRKHEVIALGLRALAAGLLAGFLTATVAGCLRAE
ncbi:MAG: nucleoside transporter C-terminal domain-containing protein [Desulfomonilaceae bacterium]|nr:nucleoside transporter C-terminal domain-containing protein [Desulfomonilaceae bacterium]